MSLPSLTMNEEFMLMCVLPSGNLYIEDIVVCALRVEDSAIWDNIVGPEICEVDDEDDQEQGW